MNIKIAVFAFTGLIALVFTIKPLFFFDDPSMVVSEARKKITEAELARANEFEPELFLESRKLYDSSLHYWQLENKKFILARKFERVFYFADRSALLASVSIANASKINGLTKDTLEAKINRINIFLTKLENQVRHFPLTPTERDQLLQSRLLLEEAIIVFENQKYNESAELLESVEINAGMLKKNYEDILSEYFGQYPKWKQWVEQSIAYTKRHQTNCLIIDKYARTCSFYNKGKLVQVFSVELGPNWIGHKNLQGDKRTPEGHYKITEKKSLGETRFYKALLLNYPNEKDKNHFALNKKNGNIHKDATIGNYIEIHGNGGKGVDWTEGCIALTNDDMDKLYAQCKVGMGVIIVGSTKPLHEIMIHNELSMIMK